MCTRPSTPSLSWMKAPYSWMRLTVPVIPSRPRPRTPRCPSGCGRHRPLRPRRAALRVLGGGPPAFLHVDHLTRTTESPKFSTSVASFTYSFEISDTWSRLPSGADVDKRPSLHTPHGARHLHVRGQVRQLGLRRARARLPGGASASAGASARPSARGIAMNGRAHAPRPRARRRATGSGATCCRATARGGAIDQRQGERETYNMRRSA